MDEVMRARIHDIVDQLIDSRLLILGIVVHTKGRMGVCWGTSDSDRIARLEASLSHQLTLPMDRMVEIHTRIADDRGGR